MRKIRVLNEKDLKSNSKKFDKYIVILLDENLPSSVLKFVEWIW